ncbi:hypothetical protein [Bradyrhizobium sp. CCBAU 11361]|nr:hypothetical protein [Bradyrhizobium sp. CCBAU 11361]
MLFVKYEIHASLESRPADGVSGCENEPGPQMPRCLPFAADLLDAAMA